MVEGKAGTFCILWQQYRATQSKLQWWFESL